MKHKAFTLIEMVIAIAIMGIMATAVVMNSRTLTKHSAKDEAVRVAAYMQSHLRRADINKDVLWFDIDSEKQKIELRIGEKYLSAELQKPDLEASGGCSYSYSSSSNRLLYNKNTTSSTYDTISNDAYVTASADANAKHYITVTGADSKKYYVLIGE